MHRTLLRIAALMLATCAFGHAGLAEDGSAPASTETGPWKPHQIEQLNGTGPRIKTPAQIQIITEPWDMGAVYYPYLVYMPEKDRLLMLLLWGQETESGVATSNDHGATWTRPKYAGDGWGMGLTYLGGGKAVYRRENRYWFSHEYGESWDHSVPVPPCHDGEAFYEDSPFLVDRDAQTGGVTRLWATGKKPGQACLVRHSDDGGNTGSRSRHIPQWGRTGEIVLHRAQNGNLLAACRLNLPRFDGQIDEFSGLGVSVSKDNGQTWSDLNILYAWGRHMSSMVTLDSGDIVLTYVVRTGYVDTAVGYPQFGIEAVVSRDHGLTWDLDHRYLIAVWRGNLKHSEPNSWQAGAQRTATVLLPDGSLITAFGTGYRTQGRQGKRTHSPQDIGIVRWHVNDGKPTPDRTIAHAPFSSKLRNVFDPKISKYALSASLE